MESSRKDPATAADYSAERWRKPCKERGAAAQATPQRPSVIMPDPRSAYSPCGPREMATDRKSVVEGTSVSVRVDLGGRCSIKKKKRNDCSKNTHQYNNSTTNKHEN